MVAPTSAKVSRRPRSTPRAPPPRQASSGTCSREWSVLGVVGSLPWSAVSSSRSPGTQRVQEAREPAVEDDEPVAESLGIVAMPPEGVEVHEVEHDEGGVGGLRGVEFLEHAHALGVALALERAVDALAGVEIEDLADRGHLDPRLAQRVQHEVGGGTTEKSRRSGVRSYAPDPPRKGRAMTRLTWCGGTSRRRETSQSRYSSASGMTSSCAAIWKTESALV